MGDKITIFLPDTSLYDVKFALQQFFIAGNIAPLASVLSDLTRDDVTDVTENQSDNVDHDYWDEEATVQEAGLYVENREDKPEVPEVVVLSTDEDDYKDDVRDDYDYDNWEDVSDDEDVEEEDDDNNELDITDLGHFSKDDFVTSTGVKQNPIKTYSCSSGLFSPETGSSLSFNPSPILTRQHSSPDNEVKISSISVILTIIIIHWFSEINISLAVLSIC